MNVGSGNGSVVEHQTDNQKIRGSIPSSREGEWWGDVLLQGQLSILSLISLSVAPVLLQWHVKQPITVRKALVAGYGSTHIHPSYVALSNEKL